MRARPSCADVKVRPLAAPAKPLTGSVQTRSSVSARVSASDPACPSGDHSNQRSSWHALIEPHIDRPQPVTRGIEKSYDASDFIFELREKAVSRHIASNINGRSTIRRPHHRPSRVCDFAGSVLIRRWFRSRVLQRRVPFGASARPQNCRGVKAVLGASSHGSASFSRTRSS